MDVVANLKQQFSAVREDQVVFLLFVLTGDHTEGDVIEQWFFVGFF